MKIARVVTILLFLGSIGIWFYGKEEMKKKDTSAPVITSAISELHVEADKAFEAMNLKEGLTAEDEEILAQISHKEIIFLRNKQDLNHAITAQEQAIIGARVCLEISALHEQGLDALADAIKEKFFRGEIHIAQKGIINNARHYEAVCRAEQSLQSALDGLALGMTNDFLVIDLNNAWDWLGMISGETVEEDLLDIIFSKFCLGK